MSDETNESASGASLREQMQRFLSEPLPAKVGWPHVLGSATLFLIVLQALTGILLGLNYDPSPAFAHDSIRYIMEEIPFGKVIRGLHHWGASLLIIVVCLHILRVFVYGAYKPPRHLLWMVGVLLLLYVLGFAFTGYLLPWDQRAFWATVVGTKIAGSIPFIGESVLRIIRGGEEVGAPTLTRFYVLHIALLPGLLFPLIFIHLYLLRRHGITAPWMDSEAEAPRTVPFFPFQVVKDLSVSLLLLVILFGLIAFAGVPLEEVADPSDASYTPRPEWYFLPLFQLLKLRIFFGRMEFVGGVVLPTAFLLLLLFLPRLDRNPSRRLPRRPVALSLAAVTVIAMTYLGIEAYRETPAQARAAPKTRGEQLFAALHCNSCHAVSAEEEKSGPRLVPGKNEREREWLSAFLVNPAGFFPGTEMPPARLAGEDMEALVDHLSQLRTDYGGHGAALPSSRACATCHRRQYEEWKDSFHARSLGPTFRAMFTVYHYNTGGKSPESCLNCHAPEVKLKKNAQVLAARLLAGEEVKSEGINCAVCHALQAAPERPDPALESVSLDLAPIQGHLRDQTKPLTPFFSSPHFCGACHDYNAGSIGGPRCCTVVESWEASSFAREGVTCQSCHMKGAMGITKAENEPANHRFLGPRDEEFLKKAVEMRVEARRVGGQMEASVAILNRTGHAIPDG